MAGFFANLFGSKNTINIEDTMTASSTPQASTPVQQPASTPAPMQPKVQPAAPARPAGSPEAFFLGMDEARTYGNVDYMRAKKTVRRTFPKTVNNPELEFEQEVSAMEAQKLGLNGAAKPSGFQAASTAESNGSGSSTSVNNGTAASVNGDRRRADSRMDAFRAMAKEIRK
jgi:hypothetical protein